MARYETIVKYFRVYGTRFSSSLFLRSRSSVIETRRGIPLAWSVQWKSTLFFFLNFLLSATYRRILLVCLLLSHHFGVGALFRTSLSNNSFPPIFLFCCCVVCTYPTADDVCTKKEQTKKKENNCKSCVRFSFRADLKRESPFVLFRSSLLLAFKLLNKRGV